MVPSARSAEPACFRASLPSRPPGVTLPGVVGGGQRAQLPASCRSCGQAWAAFLRPKDPSAPHIIPSLTDLGVHPLAEALTPGYLSISIETRPSPTPSRTPLGPSGRWPWLQCPGLGVLCGRGRELLARQVPALESGLWECHAGSAGPRARSQTPLPPPLAAQGGPAALTENVPLPRQHWL